MAHFATAPKIKQRLVGIDLFRGLAAYAVVLIHAATLMLYAGLPTNSATSALVDISRFAVPFFLASAFYLMTKKLYVGDTQYSVATIFKSRSSRLLLPYLIWSLIYFSLRMLKNLGASGNISSLFQDPVLLIFLGGASIHLYFLPLLFVGSFLIIIAKFLVNHKVQLKELIILSIISVIIYEILILSGNDFQFFTQFGVDCLSVTNACSVAFQAFTKSILPGSQNHQIIRLIFVAIAWLIRCLPYVLISLVINYPGVNNNLANLNYKQALSLLIVAGAITGLRLMNLYDDFPFSQSVYELVTAFSLLICGIAISNKMGKLPYIENLGICSFGIYLSHYLILTIYINVIVKTAPNLVIISPVFTMLLITTISFLTSWLIVSYLMKIKLIARTLFSA